MDIFSNHRLGRALLAVLLGGVVMAPTAMAAADIDDLTDDLCEPTEQACSPDPDPEVNPDLDPDIDDLTDSLCEPTEEDCSPDTTDPEPPVEPPVEPEPVDPPVPGRPSFTG